MITVTCDFCPATITTYDGKGSAISLGTVDIIEHKCDACTKETLDTEWNSVEIQDRIEAEWSVIEAERKSFLDSLLITQKEEFIELEKTKLYGTLISLEA